MRTASTNSLPIDEGPTLTKPTGAVIGLNYELYWCQPKVWGIRIADPAEIVIWKGRLNNEFPLKLEASIPVELRVHAWHCPQLIEIIKDDVRTTTQGQPLDQQALYATDERTGRIIFLVGDEPIFDDEPEEHYALDEDRYRYVWVKRARKPIYIDGKRQKIIGSRFEARYDPEGWLPRWFRFAT